MRVITIQEENHGHIGIAMTYADAVHFLVKENWLSELFEVYESGLQDTCLIIDSLGEEWFATILHWTIEQFNEYFDCCFYLQEEEVYEVAQVTSFWLRADGSLAQYLRSLCNLNNFEGKTLCILPIAFIP